LSHSAALTVVQFALLLALTWLANDRAKRVMQTDEQCSRL
jgi:hypothetical protein